MLISMRFFRKIKINKFKIDVNDVKKLFRYINNYSNRKLVEEAVIRLSKNKNIIKNILSFHRFLRKELKRKIIIEESLTIAGTGGDGKNTVNLTTYVTIISSMLGINVIKNNGNSYITNKGSNEFINMLFKNIKEKELSNLLLIYRKIKLLLFCFKQVNKRNLFRKGFYELRRKIGKVTIFNYSLSSFNVFSSKHFILCVNTTKEINTLSKVVRRNGSSISMILSSYNEIDEPTLSGKIKLIKNRKGKEIEIVIDIRKLGFQTEKNNKYLYAKNTIDSYKKFNDVIRSKKRGFKIYENIVLFLCLIFNLIFEKKISFPINLLRNINKNSLLKKKLETIEKEIYGKINRK
ncbi:hypothetical protein JSR06_00200 [Candidatus Vidania fulgoroideae]|uniref:Glycosyl transferase family 3 domain-containing protein n=1 Tax=Candidatus Vidania fulgoroideorum TaxID=881286 RepID=A0A974X9V5_9PROT|nr:hypothetical protein JSR06_00200 [Candidatus Vidania fulgoroideae]